MASPLQQIYIDYDRIDNSSKVACYYKGSVIVSKIGEWILHDKSRKTITYTYYHMLKNITGESMGENPRSIVYGFLPHLLLVLVFVVTLSHLLHILLSRLKQPFIISQIIVCFLMFLPWTNGGHGETSDDDLFLLPHKRRVETTIAFIALNFYLFLLALKNDANMIMWRIGRKPLIIGLSSMIVPLMVSFILAYIMYNNIRSFVEHREMALLCIAALYAHSPVLVLSDMLSEFGLLSSEVGRLAVSCAMCQMQTGVAFVSLFGFVNQAQHGIISVLRTSSLSLLLIAFSYFIVRPYGLWIVQDAHSLGYVREIHIFVITFTMILVALLSDLAGAIFYFGPMLMGIVLPNGPPLGTALVQRVELMGSELFLPFYFFTLGYNMDWLGASHQSTLWMSLNFIVFVICIAKFVATVLAAYYCHVPLKNGLFLGLIMNFKGNFEIMIFIQFYYGKVIDRANLTMLISSLLVIIVVCVPMVTVFYKPLDLESNITISHTTQSVHSGTELRVLSCFYDENPVPIVLDFLECLTSPETQTHTCIYPLHLIDLNACVASSLIEDCKNNGQINMKQLESVHKHFVSFGQEKTGKVMVLPFTSIAPQENMSRDICAFILERNIDLILIPYPRKHSVACLDSQHNTWSLVAKVLEQARNSIGIVVYHSISQITPASHYNWKYNIAVVFFGGPDDREAITIASRISCHPKVHINIVRFRTLNIIKKQKKIVEDSHDAEEALDCEVIDDLQRKNISNNRLVVSEVTTRHIEQIVFTLHSLGNKYDLIIVGRRRGNSSVIINMALEEGVESPELGVIGDLLASYENSTNILVVQNHNSS